MERRFLLRSSFSTVLRVSLLAILLAACSPATSAAPASLPLPSQTLQASAQASAAPMESLAATALPVATSRGPNLEATDPETVSMASGGLQFVEFFEFW